MLSISVVLFKTQEAQLRSLIASIDKEAVSTQLVLVDNSPEPGYFKLRQERPDIDYVFTGKNLGYGTGHNLAIRGVAAEKFPYHLVVNPDIYWDGDVLNVLAKYLCLNLDVALIMPKIVDLNGEVQFLCKLLPTPSDLIARRFFPNSSCKRKKSNRFELRFTGYDKAMNVPFLSGCFMFFRRSCFDEIGGFDERFFMYAEDIDFSRRLHSRWKTLYFPDVKITHFHEKASYKSFKMLLVHVRNTMRYFNKWGWFFDVDRKTLNDNVLNSLMDQNIEYK